MKGDCLHCLRGENSRALLAAAGRCQTCAQEPARLNKSANWAAASGLQSDTSRGWALKRGGRGEICWEGNFYRPILIYEFSRAWLSSASESAID